MKRLILAAPAFACLALLFTAASVYGQTETHNVRRINLPSKDLIYDAGTGKIYASVPSSAGATGNSITAIDAASGAVGASVYVGSEPGRLARSDNGQYLYVALDGALAVRRYNIAAQTAGLEFSPGLGEAAGVYTIGDLAVLPGSPGSVAVTRKGSSFGFGGASVAIYDDGVRREKFIPTNFQSVEYIEFSASSSLLYGITSGPTLQRMTVDASGLTLLSSSQISSYADFRFDNGRLYTATGRVVDPETGSLLGTFSGLPNSSTASLIVPDSTAGRVYFLSVDNFQSQSQATLRAYDVNTFLPVGSVTISGISGTPQSLIRWGANGLAFNTTGNQIFLIQTTLVPSNEPVPTPTPTPTVTPTITPSPTPPPATKREVALASNDIVYDAGTGKIYASVPSSAGATGNSITAIDAASGAVGASVYVGSEPGRLARSDNGQYLYVALDGAAAVRRYDVASQSAGLQFSVGNLANYGPLSVEDIEVAPGNPGTVAISRRRPNVSPRHGGVAIYDNGVARPTTTPDHTGSNIIEFSASSSVLYGLNTETSEFGFRRMAVLPCGVVVYDVKTSSATGYSGSFEISNGRAYTSSGRVFDPETGRTFGTFVFPNQNNSFFTTVATLPDPDSGRVYFLRAGSVFDNNTTYAALLYAYDQSTFLPLGVVSVPGLKGAATSLTKVGVDEVAFRTGGGQVILVKTTDFTAASAVPPAAPPPTPVFGIYGRVATYDNKPIAGAKVTVTGAETAEALTDANGNYKIENLSGCGVYTATATKSFYSMSPPTSTVNFATAQYNSTNGLFSVNFQGSPLPLYPDSETYTVAENAGSLRIKIVRDIPSGTMPFSYATSDASPLVNCAIVTGNASARCDYMASFGASAINGNATSQDILIPIINDTHQEGPEVFTVKIGNQSGSFFNATSTITVTIVDDDAAPATTNPIDDSGFFVRSQYLDFLSREPEVEGYNAWVDTLAKCSNVNADPGCDRIRVSTGFFDSEEFRVKGFFVYKYYRATLGKMPTFAEMTSDMLLVTGQTAEERIAKQQSFVDMWLNRPTVRAVYPFNLSNADFVDKLEQTSGVTLANKAQLIADLASGIKLKSRVMREVMESKQVSDKYYNEAFVAMQYFGYLRRDPETEGFSDWLRTISENPADVRRMVEGFINSTEYRLRFGKN